jgi:putative hemolysin
MAALLKRLLSIDGCESVYRKAQRLCDGSFDVRVLRALDITIDAPRADVDHIPSSGPLLIVANHPHGAIDGLALSTFTRRVRPDVRVLANVMLSAIPELADLCFFVDPFDGPDAAARSLAGLRAAHLWLRRGGALIVFPSGEVAHTPRRDGAFGESPWHPMAGRLAEATGATVLPAFIDGRNSRLFYAAGHLHPRLRTALLPRELLRARGSTVRVRVGSAIRSTETDSMLDAVEALRKRPPAATPSIASEIDALPPQCCLLSDGAFRVFCARSKAIPGVLQEIGRLRAATYRDAGEGTGAAVDLDAFDEEYLHLFVWDRNRRLVVGAYRLGETDRIAARFGVEGLYTRTLFRYDSRLLDRLPPALELGRSFVRKEYQRSYSALLLLWKGIGRYVALHPRYRILFGPVSISARYSDRCRQLLMTFLAENHRHDDLAALVEGLNPPSPAPTLAEAPEPDIPVLLRQYLKLNAKVIGFSVDPGFGNVLDALMLVDLAKVEPSILGRYMGRDGATAFLERHRLTVHGVLSPAA